MDLKREKQMKKYKILKQSAISIAMSAMFGLMEQRSVSVVLHKKAQKMRKKKTNLRKFA